MGSRGAIDRPAETPVYDREPGWRPRTREPFPRRLPRLKKGWDFMSAIEALEMLVVGLSALAVAIALAASALNVLFTCLLKGERRTVAE